MIVKNTPTLKIYKLTKEQYKNRLEAGLIEEVSFDEFGDSDFEGAPARADEFLDQFKGLDVKSDITVDTKTGATHSSNSVLEAVKKVAQEFGGQ